MNLAELREQSRDDKCRRHYAEKKIIPFTRLAEKWRLVEMEN